MDTKGDINRGTPTAPAHTHTCSDGERGKHSNMEVAVILALDILDERIHIVGLYSNTHRHMYIIGMY